MFQKSLKKPIKVDQTYVASQFCLTLLLGSPRLTI